MIPQFGTTVAQSITVKRDLPDKKTILLDFHLSAMSL